MVFAFVLVAILSLSPVWFWIWVRQRDHAALFAQSRLMRGETVSLSIRGRILYASGRYWGALIVTSHRVVFYRKAITSEITETMPVEAVTSIERNSSWGFHVVEVHAAHDSLRFAASSRADAERVAEVLEPRQRRRQSAIA